MKLVRHLLAIALLPLTVAVLIPLWIARANRITLAVGRSPLEIFAQVIGIVLLAIGVFLFTWSLKRFASEGDGTLAPWDPPRKLVVHGPYRYVRNPMISGVVFVLFGEAGILLSPAHVALAVTVLIVNLIYIPLVEEPQLLRRFGDAYSEYCKHVPRLLPRARPWQQ